MAVSLKVNNTEIPSPVDLSIDYETIWSSDAGRDLSGLFSGNVVAEKQTIQITWGYLTAAEVRTIRNLISSGYSSIVFNDGGGNSITMNGYRGTLSSVLAGVFGGETWYKSATCKLIQR